MTTKHAEYMRKWRLKKKMEKQAQQEEVKETVKPENEVKITEEEKRSILGIEEGNAIQCEESINTDEIVTKRLVSLVGIIGKVGLPYALKFLFPNFSQEKYSHRVLPLFNETETIEPMRELTLILKEAYPDIYRQLSDTSKSMMCFNLILWGANVGMGIMECVENEPDKQIDTGKAEVRKDDLSNDNVEKTTQ